MLKALIAGASLLALTTSASAEDSKQPEIISWGSVSGWSVAVDMTLGGGCFIDTEFETDTTFRLGINRLEGAAYVLIQNPGWSSIEPGKDYPVSLRMDDESPWTATGLGLLLNDVPGIAVTFDDIRLVDEVKRKHAIEVNFMGRRVAKLSLAGSSRALDEMLVCQKAVNDFAQTAPPEGAVPNEPLDDPFARSPGYNTASDPFAM